MNISQAPQKKIFLAATISAVMTVLLTFPAMAGKHHEVNWDSLELSEQQKSKMSTLNNQWKGSVNSLAPRIYNNEKRLRALMSSPNGNESEIMSLQQSIHEDKMRLKMNATQIFLQKRKALKPGQQEKLMHMVQPDD